MERRVGPALRWARAVILAVAAMGSGTIAHVSAGGRLPGPVAVAVLFTLCCVGAARFLAHPASTLRIVVLVISGQTLIHGVLTAMVGHRGDPPLVRATPDPLPVATPPPPVPLPFTAGRRTGSLADLAQAGRPPAQPAQLVLPAPVQHLIVDFTGPHALMAIAHLVAAVALGCWLARGERLLWAALAVTASALVDLAAASRGRTRALATLVFHALVSHRCASHHDVRPRRLPSAVSAARDLLLAVETGLRGPPYAARG